MAEHARSVAAGGWTHAGDFCYWDVPLVELAGLTLGIVGFGRIGQATAGGPGIWDERAGVRTLPRRPWKG